MRVLSCITYFLWIRSQAVGKPYPGWMRNLQTREETSVIMKETKVILEKVVRADDRVLVVTANKSSGSLSSVCLKVLSILPVSVVLGRDFKDTLELSDDSNVVRRYKRTCRSVSINYLVLLVDIVSESSLLGSLQKLIGHYCWDNRGRLVLLSTEKSSDVDAIQGKLRLLWRNYIVNAVSVILSNRYSPRVLTYNGFLEERTGSGWIEGGELFPDKLRDLHGHEIRVSIFPFFERVVRTGTGAFSGPDAWEVETVVRAMGGRTAFLLPRRWEEEFVGLMEEVTSGRADVGANGAQLGTTPLADAAVESGAARRLSAVCAAVPAAALAPASRRLLAPFSPPVWLAVLAAAAAAAVCRLLTLAVSPPALRTQGWALLVLESAVDAVRGLVCGTLPAPRGPAQLGHRVLQLALSALCLLVCGAFQGSLTGHLALPSRLPEVDTLRQLRQSGMRVFFFPGTADAYRHLDPDDPLFGLADRMVELEHFEQVMDRVARDGVAAMSSVSAGRYLAALPEYRGPDGRPLVHIMRECALSGVPIVHRMTPGCPFLERWNTLLGRVAQSGIRWRWESAVSVSRPLLHRTETSGVIVLPVEHLTGAFLALAVGCAAAALIFSIEVLLHRLHRCSA